MLCLICYIIFFKYICRYFFVKSLLYKYIDDINSIIDIEIIEVWIIDVILYTCKKNRYESYDLPWKKVNLQSQSFHLNLLFF